MKLYFDVLRSKIKNNNKIDLIFVLQKRKQFLYRFPEPVLPNGLLVYLLTQDQLEKIQVQVAAPPVKD